MSYVEYKHYFKVKSDGSIQIENPFMYENAIRKVKHRGYFIIRDQHKKVDHKIFRFYFGIVIRKYCMESNVFHGHSMKNIHKILFEDLRGNEVSIKGNKRIVVDKPFEEYDNDDMKQYLSEIIPHLATDYGIYVKSKEDDYEYKK